MDCEGKAWACFCAWIFLPGNQDASSKLEAEAETKLQTTVGKQGMAGSESAATINENDCVGAPSNYLNCCETWDLWKR